MIERLIFHRIVRHRFSSGMTMSRKTERRSTPSSKRYIQINSLSILNW